MARRPERGWHTLPRSGVPFYGPLAADAVRIDAPGGEQLVDPAQRGDAVGAGALVDDDSPETEQVVDGPTAATSASGDLDGDGDVVGHGDEA